MTRRTLADLLAAIKTAKTIYVWANITGEDGAYIPVTKTALRTALNADIPYEEGGAHRHSTVSDFDVEGDTLYISCWAVPPSTRSGY